MLIWLFTVPPVSYCLNFGIDVTFNYVSADGGRDDLWWTALPGHWLSYRMLTIFACYVFDFYVWDAVSIFNHLPRMFLSADLAFRITDWTCCHGPHLHAMLRMISWGVSGLATDSPWGVWGRGWTTCPLHVHFSAHISNESWYVSLEWYFIHLLLFLASVHGFMHETSDDVFTL